MGQRTSIPFQRAIDVIEALPLEDQETLIDLVHRRLMECRRAEIARHAAETLQAVREGRAKYGTVEDLRHDLLAEPFDRLRVAAQDIVISSPGAPVRRPENSSMWRMPPKASCWRWSASAIPGYE